ncbi:MAG: HD domain-containing protein [Lachnospiraceae bacterium]|nr:HD domain-containing protein [Lachnospiraceae bacterium]
MLFIKSDDLKPGMRLAKPIYNKSGVMLYERNSKLSSQGIVSIKNFGLIGVYILEAAEPVPPMTEDDIEFERFQAMSVFAIKDIMDAICKRKEPKEMYQFANKVLKNYGSLHRKINFIQSIRSKEDYVYKHTLNTAILCAMMTYKLKMEFKYQLDVVVAALLHDIGTLLIPLHLRHKNRAELSSEDITKVNTYHVAALQMFSQNRDLDFDIVRIVTDIIKQLHPEIVKKGEVPEVMPLGAEVLKVAYVYDMMTAMNFDEEPHSEIVAIRHLMSDEVEYNPDVVEALLSSINILSPGVCVEMTNGDRGLVIAVNNSNVLEPFVLSFRDNKVHNLGDSREAKEMQIKDIMKTMDNRHVVDNDLLAQYTGSTVHMGERNETKNF